MKNINIFFTHKVRIFYISISMPFLFAFLPSFVYSQTISTIAGISSAGYSGNGGSAASAEINDPSSIAVGASGNIYFTDSYNYVVRKINTSGIITTIAGNNVSGYSGDLGPAIAAELDRPEGLAIDGSGNLYIADEQGMRVRKVNSSGIITTLAGSGNNMNQYWYTGFNSGTPATSVTLDLDCPSDVAVDASGNVFIANQITNQIAVVAASSGTLYGQTVSSGNIYAIAGDGYCPNLSNGYGAKALGGFSGDGGAAGS